MKHARGPPRGPDVPPTVAANLPSISFDPRAARFCSRLSYVKRGFAIRRKTEIRRVVKVSLNRCISLLFRHFCFVPLPHLWKLRTEERWKKGTWKNFTRRNRASSSSKNARIDSSFLVLSHARIIGDNSWNFYRKSRTIQSPV